MTNLTLVVFHVIDAQRGVALDNVRTVAQSPNGRWESVTNACGDVRDPVTHGAGVSLSPGHYDVTFTRAGYVERTVPVDIDGYGPPIVVGLTTAAAVLPPPPTRDQVCQARIGFQGLTATTREYGTFPMFGPETTTLADDDLVSYCQQLRAAGFTHGEIAVSWLYNEPGFLMPVPGRDLTQDLPELARRITLMLTQGGLTAVILFCAGDGLSAPQNPDGSWPYNDPVGHTYGYEWLMQHLAGIVSALQTAPAGDLTPYVLFSPGYDGVFYGWGRSGEVPDGQPRRVQLFAQTLRELCPQARIAIEHSSGNIPTGLGAADFTQGGTMADYDCILSEFPTWTATGGATWQVAKRMLGPGYVLPPDQAGVIAAGPSDPRYPEAHDTYSGAGYLAAGTARGPYYAVAYEYATYPWTRGQIDADDVARARAYYQALGYAWVC